MRSHLIATHGGETFHQEAVELLTRLGGIRVSRNRSTFDFDTRLGRLEVTPTYDCLHARFDEPHRARSKVLCNRFSGQWNFHGNNCLELFEETVTQIL